jgi:20S proteasome subunit beta 6
VCLLGLWYGGCNIRVVIPPCAREGRASIARLIQTTLYGRYYVYNILGGIEADGAESTRSGVVHSFDPVGSYEREACRAAGAAQSLVQPFLDNQVRHTPGTGPPPHAHRLLDLL